MPGRNLTEVRLVLGPSEVRGEEGPRGTVPNGESSGRSGARCASQTRVPPTPGLGARAVAGWPRQCPRSLDRASLPRVPRGSQLVPVLPGAQNWAQLGSPTARLPSQGGLAPRTAEVAAGEGRLRPFSHSYFRVLLGVFLGWWGAALA